MRRAPRRPAHRLAAAALVGALALGASGCSTGTPIDNIVEGLIGQGVEQITAGIDESVRDLVDDVLGGVELSTDGKAPSSFPNGIPLTGEVLGGERGLMAPAGSSSTDCP